MACTRDSGTRAGTRRTLLCVATAIILGVAAWIAADEIAETYAYGFEKVSISGVPNAGQINAHLYRGGQPTEAGLAALRSLGVDTIVSFTLDGEGARTEADVVRSLGMQYIHLPWSANTLPPDTYISQFLDLTEPARQRIVFAHCKAGSDRTGLMIAAYRIRSNGWAPERAIEEMNAFGYEIEFHPQLRRFVRALAR